MKVKVKIFQAILITVVLLLQIVLPTTMVFAKNNEGEQVTIQFQDANMFRNTVHLLESKIISSDSSSNKIVMTQESIDSVKTLEYTSSIYGKISNISGIENFRNLEILNLAGNPITDITPISGLTKLKTIYLNSTKVANISTLSGLSNLESVYLNSDKEVTNISPLAGLTKLRVVFLNDTNITDITPLAGKTTITSLSLSGTEVTDISAVSAMTNLSKLNLYSTKVADLNAISGLENLVELNISANKKITDLTPLSGLRKIKILDMGHTLISDISPIADITTIELLNADYSYVSDISALKKLTNLKSVYLSNSTYNSDNNAKIKDLSALAGKTKIEILHLNNNNIDNLEPLAGLVNLKELWLDTNNVEDIDSLSSLTSLIDLRLNDNNVKDISPLARLNNLKILELGSNEIEDISNLPSMNEIEYLMLYDNHIRDFSPLEVYGDRLNELFGLQKIIIIGQTIFDSSLTNIVDLPQTIISAIDRNGLAYTGDIEFENCTLSTDKRKITVLDKTIPARIIISTGRLEDTEYHVEIAKNIKVNDINLYNSLKESLADKISQSDDENQIIYMTQENVDAVKTITAEGKGIKDLIGLEYFTNVTSLKLAGNQISNLDAIAGLTNLYVLKLDSNRLEDISALAELTNLKILTLSNNNIENIGTISRLTNLEELNLAGNCIKDINAIGNLINLKNLDITENEVKDLSVIENLSALENLEAGHNNIEDISVFGNLENPGQLYANLEYNHIYSIDVLENLINDYGMWATFNNQEITIYAHDKVIDLPPLLVSALNEDSYGCAWGDISYVDCLLENDKIILDEDEDTSNIFIDGGGLEGTVIIIKEAKVTDLVIGNHPIKTDYIEGEEFDPTGLEIIAIYNSGEEIPITGYTIEPNRPLEVGDDKIKITYEENGETVTIEIPITVRGKNLERIEITKAPDKTEYVEGESFDPTGMEVTAYYDNGESIVLENDKYEIIVSDPLTMEDTEVKVKYEEKEATLLIGGEGGQIVIIPKPEEEIEIELDEDLEIEKDEENDIIYIKGIQPKTMISTVLEKIRTNGEIQVYGKEQNKEEDYTKYATSSMKLRIIKGEKQAEYVLVVRGDCNGDGDANFSDMLKINKHRLEKVLLEGAYLRAGNVNTDEAVNFSDMLRINKFRLNKIEIL